MPSPFPYTTKITGPGSMTITEGMNVTLFSVVGNSATSSSIKCNNPIVGLQAPSDVTLDKGKSYTLSSLGFSEQLKNITVTVPAGGEVDILIETV